MIIPVGLGFRSVTRLGALNTFGKNAEPRVPTLLTVEVQGTYRRRPIPNLTVRCRPSLAKLVTLHGWDAKVSFSPMLPLTLMLRIVGNVPQTGPTPSAVAGELHWQCAIATFGCRMTDPLASEYAKTMLRSKAVMTFCFS